MPIYAYKCASCGFAKDVLQKISDAPLTVCPSCGESAFSKQLRIDLLELFEQTGVFHLHLTLRGNPEMFGF